MSKNILAIIYKREELVELEIIKYFLVESKHPHHLPITRILCKDAAGKPHTIDTWQINRFLPDNNKPNF